MTINRYYHKTYSPCKILLLTSTAEAKNEWSYTSTPNIPSWLSQGKLVFTFTTKRTLFIYDSGRQRQT